MQEMMQMKYGRSKLIPWGLGFSDPIPQFQDWLPFCLAFSLMIDLEQWLRDRLQVQVSIWVRPKLLQM